MERAIPEPTADPAGTISAADRALILDLAARTGMAEWAASPGTVIAVGDGETYYELVPDGDGIAFVVVQRGHRSTHVRFGSVADAVRFLVFMLADQRSGPEWPPIVHEDFAPGAAYAPAGEDWVLQWPGGSAVSPHRRLLPARAREFSWVATAAPADIARSYRSRTGAPLFDLAVAAPGARRRPTATLKPRPLESPPADPDAAAEEAAILALVAEIGMSRRPLDPGDSLAVGWDHSRRAIGYRHGMFQFSSGAGDSRTILATASSAAAARRLLVMEVAALARMQRRQQPVHLRVRGPAVDFTVTQAPTEFMVEGNGIRATFPLGPVGRQRALTFTYCADAPLDDIVASYRDPGGAPLLD